MNWSKAKSILIVFFLLMNIILLCNIVYSTGKATIITPEILSSTVEVLKKNDITINPDIIPTKSHSLAYVEAKNIIVSGGDFAAQILGSDFSKKSDILFESKSCTLELEGDYFTLICKTPQFGELTEGINAENAEKKALAMLHEYGIDLGRYTTQISEADGKFTVLFTKKIGASTVFDAKIKMIISPDGLDKIWGKWFNEVTSVNPFGQKTELDSITSTLVEFILNEERPKTPIAISSLDLGYSVAGDNLYHASVVLTPSWEITLSDNSSYIVNAQEY